MSADHDEIPAAPGPGAPLAARLRPASIDEVVGQEHVLGTPEAPTALRARIAAGDPESMVLYGPPGTGKTTLARLVGGHAGAVVEELSAVEVGRKEVREVLARAQNRRQRGARTVLFLDEIHRFNKAQQDTLLPAVEDGTITLIGATTENPYFEVNSALLSRMRVYELQLLADDDLRTLLRRALAGPLAPVTADDDAIDFLAVRSAGDARTALGAIESAARAVIAARAGEAVADAADTSDPNVTLADAEEALQRRAVRYDKDRDQHYDTISAFIKSTRASDPDAALYYLAVMLEGGEDPRFLARRILVLASEDVGNADPGALQVAAAAAQAVEHIGMPECSYALAQATIRLALAPKSKDAYYAINAARDHVRRFGAQTPPAALRGANYPGAKALGRGKGYDDPHRHPDGLSPANVMPAGLEDLRFYDPGDREGRFRDRLREIAAARGRPMPDRVYRPGDQPPR
ncbi:MAG: replication-associated recombination protein A [Solirubrobacteraceae bacterium]|nr:replication-associated recombination protein A [Solirubrobacteraceae bacterium]